MTNLKILDKQIEALTNLTQKGKGNSTTQKLLRNLYELRTFASQKACPDQSLESVTKKQSISNTLDASVRLLSSIEKMLLMQDLSKPLSEEEKDSFLQKEVDN